MLGFGAIGGLDGVAIVVAEVCCKSRPEFCTLDRTCRDFGGGGAFEGSGCDFESSEELRSAIGFRGGGGAVLMLETEDTEAR